MDDSHLPQEEQQEDGAERNGDGDRQEGRVPPGSPHLHDGKEAEGASATRAASATPRPTSADAPAAEAENGEQVATPLAAPPPPNLPPSPPPNPSSQPDDAATSTPKRSTPPSPPTDSTPISPPPALVVGAEKAAEPKSVPVVQVEEEPRSSAPPEGVSPMKKISSIGEDEEDEDEQMEDALGLGGYGSSEDEEEGKEEEVKNEEQVPEAVKPAVEAPQLGADLSVSTAPALIPTADSEDAQMVDVDSHAPPASAPVAIATSPSKSEEEGDVLPSTTTTTTAPTSVAAPSSQEGEEELTVADELEMAVAHELEDIEEVPEGEPSVGAGEKAGESEAQGKEEKKDDSSKVAVKGAAPVAPTSTSDAPSAAVASVKKTRAPPVPAGGLAMPLGMQSMSQKDVRKRFNGHKIMCVLALNTELIK